MITWGQAARLEKHGITVVAAAPGFVKTDFNANAKGFMAMMIGLSARLFAVSPTEGADTPLWCAVAPELEGVTGEYFDARKKKDGRFRDAAAIADLERRCDAMIASPATPREPRAQA
jgi:NAD(P)-dependent dehydrogenase (short-subunit alcohol dehydrogenase family)